MRLRFSNQFLIRILLRTDPLAVAVVVAAIVAVVAIRTRRSGRSHCRSPVAHTWTVIATTITGIPRDWAAGATCYRAARTTRYGPTCYRMRGVQTPARIATAAAVNASAMHAAAAMESTATATEAATSATPSIGIIWDQARRE
jgi:hypothetical protein